jgi:hypothetical protein
VTEEKKFGWGKAWLRGDRAGAKGDRAGIPGAPFVLIFFSFF